MVTGQFNLYYQTSYLDGSAGYYILHDENLDIYCENSDSTEPVIWSVSENGFNYTDIAWENSTYTIIFQSIYTGIIIHIDYSSPVHRLILQADKERLEGTTFRCTHGQNVSEVNIADILGKNYINNS